MMQQGSVGLFLDPGMGKTSTCLMSFQILKQKGLISKALVIAPLRPCYKVWPDEMKKWADFAELTYTIVHGGNKEVALAKDVDVYIINPEGLKWLFAPGRKRPQFDGLIVDESTKFKDSTTQRFKALKPFLQQFTRRWILTGTPVPNGLMDLFGQIYILDLGRSLGRFITHYRNQYFTPSGYGGYDWKIRPGSYDEIVDKISPLLLQFKAEDWLAMPELISIPVRVTLPSKVMHVYKEVDDEFLYEWTNDIGIVAKNAAAAGTKLRQVANGAVYDREHNYLLLHDEKLDALEDILEELNGHSVLIIYEFGHDLERIRSRLGNIPSFSGTSGAKLEQLVDGFNDGSIPLVIGHPDGIAHGLNLQNRCHHIIFFGITWNLELHDQVIRRIYRQGQSSDRVLVYYIIARETKDEEVMEILAKKDRTQRDLLLAIQRNRENVASKVET